MRIGIDLDHTIINYEAPFLRVAKQWKIVPADFVGTKEQLKTLILQKKTHQTWMKLQGYVYAKGIVMAKLMEGIKSFILTCMSFEIEVVIVSHKTIHGHFDEDKINLRQAAISWLTAQGFFAEQGLGFARSNVYFEPTRALKLKRIKLLECTHFIDDLFDLLTQQDFPADVKRFWYAPHVEFFAPQKNITRLTNWTDAASIILGK